MEPNERRVEVYRRLDDGTWRIIDVLEGKAELTSIDVRLALDDVYAKTDGLPPDEA